jgi:hypothetical protein
MRTRKHAVGAGEHGPGLVRVDHRDEHHVAHARHLGGGPERRWHAGELVRRIRADVVHRGCPAPAGEADGHATADHAEPDHARSRRGPRREGLVRRCGLHGHAVTPSWETAASHAVRVATCALAARTGRIMLMPTAARTTWFLP